MQGGINPIGGSRDDLRSSNNNLESMNYRGADLLGYMCGLGHY